MLVLKAVFSLTQHLSGFLGERLLYVFTKKLKVQEREKKMRKTARTWLTSRRSSSSSRRFPAAADSMPLKKLSVKSSFLCRSVCAVVAACCHMASVLVGIEAGQTHIVATVHVKERPSPQSSRSSCRWIASTTACTDCGALVPVRVCPRV